jgi:hypothetical protein
MCGSPQASCPSQPPAIAGRKWTSLSSLILVRIPSIASSPSTATAIYGKIAPSGEQSRAPSPGKAASKLTTTSRRVAPGTTTDSRPPVTSRISEGIQTVAIGYCAPAFSTVMQTRSGLSGSVSKRTPVARWIAFATAPAGGTMQTSPTPRTPYG